MAEKPTFYLEYRIVKRDSDVGNMQPRYHIERIAKSGPLPTESTDQNSINQRQAEEALQKALDELERSAVERTAQLIKANEELQIEMTERKRKEDQLVTIINDSPIPTAVVGSDGSIISFNEALENLIGYKRAEVKDVTDWANKMYPDNESRDFVWKNIEQALAGKKPDYTEFSIICKDGSERLIDFYTSFFQEGLIIQMIDDTDRKQAEEALRESEERYRTFLEVNPDPVIVYDMAGKVVYLNPAFTNVFGWTIEERLGKKMDIFVPDENWSETQMMTNKGLAGENFSGMESRRYTKERDILDVSISGAVHLDPNGNPVRTVVNLRDITKQKKLETQLQQAQRMEALGTLAGGIAHDFNNLLMGIQGRTSLMLLDTDFSHPYLEHLEGIENYVKSAADLTKQLLGFARGGKYEVKPTDFNEIVKRTSSMFGRTKKEITIHRKYQKDVWIAEVDQSQIDQVLLNLYVNAWQAMPGGGDLFIETENVTFDENYVKPFAIEPGNYVKISITDTGVGMDEATQKRVFEPFFTTKEMGRGMGLGLASVYGIIKNHGGIINVYSKRGQGSTFNIFLPASKKELTEEEKEKKRIPEDLLRGEETILLVDDEDRVIDVGEQILKRLGYNVLLARSGKEAVDVYVENKDKIDMVILDMIMPDMDGGEVYDTLKGTNPEIKVLLSTGYSINEQATEILNRGCNGFIQKPFNIKELSNNLREILDQEKS